MPKSAITTYCIAAASSIFFCSKGVFAKSAYAFGAQPIEVLALRMGMALPFFLAVAWATSRGAPKLTRADLLKLAGLGFIGYYLSSFVNFSGLQHITVGLERIVLYTYPSLVLLGAALFKRQPLRRGIVIGMAVSYLGILVAFAGEATSPGTAGGSTLVGVALVFTSALTYAFFISTSGAMITKLGALRFTSFVVGFSCIFILAHYAISGPQRGLMSLPRPVYLHGALLAIIGTVVPSFLLGLGLQRAGAQKFAIIGTVGPVATFLLAWAMLGEVPDATQLLGFGLALSGGLSVSLLKDPVDRSGSLSSHGEKVMPLTESGRQCESADLLPRTRQPD